MEVLEDQPFEVLDSAACGDMSQEPSHLGMLVCVRVCVTVYGMCDAVISFFLLIKQASLTCVCTYTNQCFHLSTFHLPLITTDSPFYLLQSKNSNSKTECHVRRGQGKEQGEGCTLYSLIETDILCELPIEVDTVSDPIISNVSLN